MTQNQARRVIQDLRASIQSRGYEQSPKQYLGKLFNDLRLAEASKPGAATIRAVLPGEAPTLTPMQALEARLRKDRDSADGGAFSIHAILTEMEAQVQQLLPIDLPKIEEKTWPAMTGAKPAEPSNADVDRLLARMRERHASLAL
jgi:hypothetical protein